MCGISIFTQCARWKRVREHTQTRTQSMKINKHVWWRAWSRKWVSIIVCVCVYFCIFLRFTPAVQTVTNSRTRDAKNTTLVRRSTSMRALTDWLCDVRVYVSVGAGVLVHGLLYKYTISDRSRVSDNSVRVRANTKANARRPSFATPTKHGQLI